METGGCLEGRKSVSNCWYVWKMFSTHPNWMTFMSNGLKHENHRNDPCAVTAVIILSNCIPAVVMWLSLTQQAHTLNYYFIMMQKNVSLLSVVWFVVVLFHCWDVFQIPWGTFVCESSDHTLTHSHTHTHTEQGGNVNVKSTFTQVL